MIHGLRFSVLALVFFFSWNTLYSQANFSIRFEHAVGTEALILDSLQYKNVLGQNFTVSKFKYYVSNFRLKRNDGKEEFSKEVFLINEEDSGSKHFLLKDIPAGKYASVQFTLGVDSILYCSGVQSGALDPVNGMFWTWNTGYIFLKLEGKSPESTANGNIFEYHIGGYKTPANCIRQVILSLKERDSEISEISIKADVAEIFKNTVTLDLAKLNSVTDFHNAEMVADNYSKMFSILEESKAK